jgi:hypothetical protein
MAGVLSILSKQPTRVLFCFLIFVLVTGTLPWRWSSRHARRWYEDDATLQTALGRGVAHWIEGEALRCDNFSTGSSQFDGEWLFGSYLMAGIGFGQLISLHPEEATTALPLMEQCITRILEDDVRDFDRKSWKSDPILTLDSLDEHHAAYLGYLNVLLGLFRLHSPQNCYAELHDQITESLIARLEHSDIGLLLTYPGEVYPVDNCAVVGSIGLHARATGADHRALISEWVTTCREDYLDAETGLLIQAVGYVNGTPIDMPRGSGTTLGSFFINFADPELSASLTAAVREHLFGTMLGFGGVGEYLPDVPNGMGDIDSGPILFGYGLSATGFAISGVRTHGDYAAFRRLWATAHGAGAPLRKEDRINFITGASLGDGILFAMLTAHSADTLRPLEKLP